MGRLMGRGTCDVSLRVARSGLPHRLDMVDLADDRRLRAVLAPDYDVVLLLAVNRHVEKARGEAAARRMLATLAERSPGCCRSWGRAASPPEQPAREILLAASAPTSSATMKPGTSEGAIPAKVSLSDRAMVTAGLAKDVDAVNQ